QEQGESVEPVGTGAVIDPVAQAIQPARRIRSLADPAKSSLDSRVLRGWLRSVSEARAMTGGPHGAGPHRGASSCTGLKSGAPLSFSSTTTNLAGSESLALRPTT